MVWKQVWILKATISSFIFCCRFSVPHPLPAFVSLFCSYLFLSTSYSLCPTQFSLLGLPLQAQVISLKAFDRKPPVVLRSNGVPRMGHDIALPVLTHLPRKRTKDVLTSCDLTVSLRPSSGVEWLKGKKKLRLTSLRYWMISVQWSLTLAAQRITWGAIQSIDA